MPTKEQADVVIIGGGVVGTAIARELAKYKLAVILLEEQPDLAMGTTKANSAILHAGFDATVGSLKATLNVRGNELYRQMKDELDLEINMVGSLVVALDDEEMKTLSELQKRGHENGVPGLEIFGRDQVLAMEPNLSPDIAGALYAPTGGIMLPFGVALAFAENASRNGVQVRTECPVTGFVIENGAVVGVKTPEGVIAAKYVVNAAGTRADAVSRLAGDDSFAIQPRKGEYILFDKSVGNLVKTAIFPTPTKLSKGILVSPTIHGNIFIGPNAFNLTDKDDVATTAPGMAEIIAGARRLLPGLPLASGITQFAGLRAVADSGDFVIRPSSITPGLVHAAGIQSPGLSAAPAIGEKIVAILGELGLPLLKKTNFIPGNPRHAVFSKMDMEARHELVAQNPLYGKIICRCETITEAEIVDAIQRPCGARTVDGVKRRTRAGMGRCQGGFCGPRVTAILARELKIPLTAVRKDAPESYLFYDKIAGNCEVKDNV